MNRAELYAALDMVGLAHVRVGSDVIGEDAYTIRQLPSGDWQVFYTERGQQYDRRVFGSEHDACLYIFDTNGGVDAALKILRQRGQSA